LDFRIGEKRVKIDACIAAGAEAAWGVKSRVSLAPATRYFHRTGRFKLLLVKNVKPQNGFGEARKVKR
jgi:hypothetical protein